jgi:hypothetical protein
MISVRTEASFLRHIVESNLLAGDQAQEAQRMLELCEILCRIIDIYDRSVESGDNSEQFRMKVRDTL